ncbi:MULTISPECIES: hypothetical protein [unclassified Aeromonas]|jgi:hypothetical protein|uniref:hypothetical protein n=1 Tax=unclassified Aeromonas TaxID=257493 RepID=UPI0022DEF130|nr:MULTISPECIES: hypothetical protein [unclassified Aeromonas]
MHSFALQPPLQKEKPNTDHKATPDAVQRTKNQIYHLVNSKIENQKINNTTAKTPFEARKVNANNRKRFSLIAFLVYFTSGRNAPRRGILRPKPVTP